MEDKIIECSRIISDAIKNGGKLLICGNGGSFSQAQHFAAELVGRYKKERRGLPAIALGSNGAALTAIANDYDYESVFAREVEALGKSGDILVGLSTSGNSKNVLAAVKKAKEIGLVTIGLSGKGGALKDLVDFAIAVDSEDTPRIQEEHLCMIHEISEKIENSI